ncbi:MAG: adenylyl-sulfate kinase [Phycisphaerae bacterium]|nr:adenylyl-sulfate kinase [Phycisphaerae bacterium]
MHSMQERAPDGTPGRDGKPALDANVVWHHAAVTAQARQACARQRGATIWLTGLSGSGKSTIAVELERSLIESGHLAFRLDGDNLRHGLNAGVGFDASGRAEAVRRAGEASMLVAGAGAIAIVCMISPYAADRDAVRARHAAEGVPFVEVHVDAPLQIAEQRDPKGLYAKARKGEIRGFTGIDDPYEAPRSPEVHLRTDQMNPQQCVAALFQAVLRASSVPAA